jgi:signal transduction histidine kinase/DNA-binding response OmpR family regulator
MAWMPLQLLIVEDRPDDAELLLAELKRAGYDPDWTRAETLEEFAAGLERNPDIIVCDYSLPSMTAPDALRILREQGSDVPLIVVSGVMDEETCVTSLRLGAVDYLLKDRLVRLGPAIADALAARKLAELATTAGREREETAEILRGVVDHAPAAICVRDAEGNTLMSNSEFDRLQPPASRGPCEAEPECPKALTAVEQACLDGTSKMEREETFEVDGEEHTFLVVRYPVEDGEGRRFAVGAIYVDISQQKKVEEELRALDKFKDDFVATVSHELRTPLTSIFGYTELLLAVAEDESSRRMVEVIERNSRRLLSLVDDLLTLSRVDSGALARMDGEVDLAELVASVSSDLQPSMEDSRITLEVKLAAGLPCIVGDRQQLERVLSNLISNAVKFSEPSSTVIITGELAGPDLRFTVTDTGMGIPADEQAQIFDRFFRTDEARRRVIQGSGLGLSVVHEIVQRHHGRIGVESAPDQGTTMTVTLPAAVPVPRSAPDDVPSPTWIGSARSELAG